jgi:hypothetical protein
MLAYKSRNFGQNLANILSIQLIRGSHFFSSKRLFCHYLCVLSLFSKVEEDLKFWILDHILDLFFQFDLYADRLIR